MRSATLAALAASLLFHSGQGFAQSAEGASPPPDQPFSFAWACSPEYLDLIDPCVVQSRQTFAQARERFNAGLPKGYVMMVVMLLRDGSGSVEQVFVRVHRIDRLSIVGSLASKIMGVKGFELGDPVVLSEREIIDWVIVDPAGKEEGNLVGKYLDLLQAGKVEGECSGA